MKPSPQEPIFEDVLAVIIFVAFMAVVGMLILKLMGAFGYAPHH